MRIRSKVHDTKKALKFPKCDGSSDPYLHLCIYSDELLLITMYEDLHTKLFLLSLTGETLQ